MNNRETNIVFIHRLISATRYLLRLTWFATGMAVALGMFLATLLAVTLTDVAFPLWPAFRFLGFVGIVSSTAWIVVIGVLRPLWRRLSDVAVARRIESEIPDIRNRLVSCVDLAERDDSHPVSPAFHRRLLAETWEQVRGFSVRRVVDRSSVRRASWFAVVSVALTVMALAVFSGRLRTAVARVLQPLADIPPTSHVFYDVVVGGRDEPGDCEVLHGEDVVFTVTVRKGEVEPPGTPDSLRLEVKTVDDQGRSMTLRYPFPEVQGQRTMFTFAGMQDSFTYRVHGGRTWTKRYRVTMLDRPRIVRLRTVLHYPDYMKPCEPQLGAPQVADVEGPAGSTIEVFLDVEGHAAEGEIELSRQPVDAAVEREVVLARRVPLQRSAESKPAEPSEFETWRGRFPLEQDGFFRVAFRNRLGYPSKPMQAAQLTAIPDGPPQILIDRPGQKLVVSGPVKVPLFVSAYDDFGVRNLLLFTQLSGSERATSRSVRNYETTIRRESVVVTLDLAAERLQPGKMLRYWLQARDSKGQEAETRQHEVRISDTNDAADRQFADFREETEALQKKLGTLIDAQAKIQQSVHEMNAEKSLPGDELSQVARQQKQNLEFARQIGEDLAETTDKSRNVPWLPEEIVNHLQSVNQAFEPLALQPMQGVNQLLERAAQSGQEDPPLSAMQRQSDLLQKNLEDLRDRMESLIRAQRHDWENMGQALTELERDLFKQNADHLARDLAELREFIDSLREDVQQLEDVQEQLIKEGEQELADRALEQFLNEQAKLDAEAAERLAETEELLNSEQLQELRDPRDALNKPSGNHRAGQSKDAGGRPTSGGSEPAQANSAGKSQGPGERDQQREPLRSHQQRQADELRAADGSLKAAQQDLEELLGQYNAQLPSDGLVQLTSDQIDELADLVRSEATEDALDMFQRMRKMLADAETVFDPNASGETHSPMDAPFGHLFPPPSSVEDLLLEFGDLDANVRTTIMKMQPRAREELLQGLREEGPEGYRHFIRDYFRRLTRAGSESP